MGRGAAGPPSEFSRMVAENIERFRKSAGISSTDLIEAAGLSRTYYFARMRFELPFNTNDVDHIAAVLGVSPTEISSPPPRDDLSHSKVDSATLTSRLARIVRHKESSGPLQAHLRSLGFVVTEEDWGALVKNSTLTKPMSQVLTMIAEQHSVPPFYLLHPTTDDVSDRIDAELELRFAMEDMGAKSVQARALGEMSPNGLRAIARALAQANTPEDEETPLPGKNRRRTLL